MIKTGKKLRLQDIINLEYFFQQDRDLSPGNLHERDRAFASTLPQKKLPPADAINHWLTFRLRQEFSGKELRSPGEIFADFFQLISIVIVFSGILSGTLAGLAFFSYSGTTPVNVFQFLLIFIAPQLILIALLLLSATVAKVQPKFSVPTFYSFFFKRLTNLLLARLNRLQQKHTSAARRNAEAQAFAMVKMHSSRYGNLFYWPFFCLLQGFGFAFNLGLLAISLLKIATCDLAFGWQSTIQFSDAAVQQFTAFLALPWSWIAGGENLLPTIAEIAGSRIILKDGISHLATADLTSWWPFLIMCLLVYGVFSRTLFLGIGWFIGTRAKAAVPFNTPQCKALLQRMNNPLVATQAPKEAKVKPEEPAAKTAPVSRHDRQDQSSPSPSFQPSTLTTFVAVDVYEQFGQPQQELTTELARFNLHSQKITPFLADYTEDQQLLTELEQRKENQDILLLLEGWMVPLVSTLSYIKEMRLRVGAETAITVALVGQPAETVFTPVTEKDFTIWQQKIDTLADPYLQVVPIAGINEV